MIPGITEFEALCETKKDMLFWGYLFHLYMDIRFFVEYLPRYFTLKETPSGEKTPGGKEKIHYDDDTYKKYAYKDFDNIDAVYIRQYPEVFENICKMHEHFEGFLQNMNQEFRKRYENAKEKKVEEMKLLDLDDLSKFLNDTAKEFVGKYGEHIKPSKDREQAGQDR